MKKAGVLIIIAGILLFFISVSVMNIIKAESSQYRTSIYNIMIDNHGKKYYVTSEQNIIHFTGITIMFGSVMVVGVGVCVFRGRW